MSAAHPQNARPRTDWDPVERFREQALMLSSTVDAAESGAGVAIETREARDGDPVGITGIGQTVTLGAHRPYPCTS